MDETDISTSPGAETSRDPDTLPPLWHEDGDIILAVPDIDKTYRFRVHRLVLSLQSPVFKDMFQLGHKNEASDDADCPSVTLHDSLEDVRVFLKALYEGL
jgi:BTB/POZ domain